ncbi:MAG: DMT family transporter [Rhizobiaceae bacterium]|nr:DMT family transporter [Rhizobiaceae bacterium]
MIAFAAFVAGSFSFGALAVPYIAPAPLNAVRFAIGAGLMAGCCLALLGTRPKLPAAPWRFLVLGGLMAAFFITMFTSLAMTDPVSLGAVFTLMPLMGAILGWVVLGQVPRGAVLASLLLAASGALWVIFRGDVHAITSFRIGAGELLFMGGVACHALFAVMIKKLGRGEPVVLSTFWTLASTGLCIALYGVSDILATDWMGLPMIVWLVILYLATFTTAGTFFLIQFAAPRMPASKVLAYNYLTPSIIILFEGMLGHGWATPAVVAGAAVTVLGLALLAATGD